MKNADFSQGYLVPNKVKIDLHVLGALVLYWIGGEIYCTDIVAIHDSGFARRATKLFQ
jgi:hypothetical protein